MRVRVNKANFLVIRGGKRLCKTSTTLFFTLLILSSVFFILSFLTDSRNSHNSNLFLRQSELLTWNSNQSVELQEYIDPTSLTSFLLQPKGAQDFNLKLNESSPYCGPKVNILIVITSAPANFESRNAVRSTWGSIQNTLSKGIRVIFILGNSGNSTIENRIESESRYYGDLIQEDFYDSYHNLTLKSVALLKWVNLTCFNTEKDVLASFPRYVLKTDDDIFFNIDRLLTVIHELPFVKLIGRLICGAVPISDTNDKFYMPKYLFPGQVYPGYLSGTAYVLKGEIIPNLLKSALTQPLIHLEDIYVTGILAKKNNYTPYDSPFFTYNHVDPKDFCAFKYMVNSHRVTPKEMHFLWKNYNRKVSCRKQKWLRKVPKMSKKYKSLCQFQ